MTRLPLPHLILAATLGWQGARGAGAEQPAAPAGALAQPAGTGTPAPILRAVDFQGGRGDDAEFALEAAALEVGAPCSDPAFQEALAAIRLTDRFRSVEGGLVPVPDGVRVRIRVDPWPALQRLEWKGDARRGPVWKFIRGLRKGMRPGDQRLDAWARDLREHLVEAGYPSAQVAWARADADRTLAVTVDAGAPTLVRRVELVTNPAPYTEKEILSAAGLVPGKTLWTQATQLAALRSLRARFRKQMRYEARVDLAWDGQGTVRVTALPGPRVNLDYEGDNPGPLKDLVPLARADRYSPELLDEGDRAIVRALRAKGYLDAQVGHRREVTSHPGSPWEEVTVTYVVQKGKKAKLDDLRFEGNAEVGEADLKAAVTTGKVFHPKMTPDLLDAVEDRVKAVYEARGFTAVSLRRQVEREGGRNVLVLRIREGPRRLLQWVRLELPAGLEGDLWSLGACLPLIFADNPVLVSGSAQARTYASDRPALAGVRGVVTLSTLEAAPGPASRTAPPGTVLTLTLDRPIPMLKADLARVYNTLRQQRLPALGLVRPMVRLAVVPDDAGGTGVKIEVPPQPQEKFRRLVVTGADKTRADAVFRETRLKPGAPLDTDGLSRAQARLGNIGAFQRVDLESLAPDRDRALPEPGEAPATPPPPVPWKEGDLQLKVEERPPYVITNSFGYDKSQGYYLGVGLQQVNVGGMGRTIDYSIRAGDGTIQNPTLRKWFPTGTYNRSVDEYKIAYTDPWFAPPALQGWLPDRLQFRTEGAYIQEVRDLYDLHRRRYTASWQWSLNPRVSLAVGYRWERTDVNASVIGIDTDQLAIIAQYPVQAVVSAPFIQVARDTRDNSFDPTTGLYSVARLEFANRLFLTSPNSSFVKLDVKNQWTWPVGFKAKAGVLAFGVHLGAAKPTAARAHNLPLAERFFAGGPFSFRGTEPDALGNQAYVPLFDAAGNPVYIPGAVDPVTGKGIQAQVATPLGGQGLVLLSLEYRFPILRKSVWGEVFVDSGQVYYSLSRPSPEVLAEHAPSGGTPPAAYPPFRTAPGLGLIFKIGIPIKVEYAADLNRILGRPRSQQDRDTQLKSLLISAGFQF